MSIGASIFLLVIGAILTFAVNVDTEGFNLNTVGIILMVAGVVGLLLSLLLWSNISPYRRRSTTAYPEERVVEERRIERDYP
jgi:predicted membrane channel-forming protein YqfA (hemolysin III family)